MASVKANDLKGDADTAFEDLDDEWFAFCEAKAKEIAEQLAQKPAELADGEINHYAMFLDNTFHEIAIMRLRKTAQYRAALAKDGMVKRDVERVLEELPELAALKTVLEDIYGRKIDERD